jgi:tetratricopeptide (TPR) repeat protein
MGMQTKLSLFCEKIIEAGWLTALIVVPLFFNRYSHRVFEPDKLALLRSVSLFIVTAWVIRFIDRNAGIDRPEIQKGGAEEDMENPGFLQHVLHTPLVLPILFLAGSYLLSTLLSVIPRVSLWGSYNRLQGTFTFFSYLVFFFSTLGLMRKENQLDHLWNVLILASLPISLYGLLQHFHMDPIPWGGERAASVPLRVVSTMGNPIFLGAYLVFVLPVTLARIIEIVSAYLDRKQKSISYLLLIILYVCIMGLQFSCLLFTQSRGPWLGFTGGFYLFILIALLFLRRREENQGPLRGKEIFNAFVFMLLAIPAGIIPAYLLWILLKRGSRWLWLSWVFHALVTGGIFILLVLPHAPLSSLKEIPYFGRIIKLSHTETGSVQVRMLIWKGSLELFNADKVRAIIGYGPESLQTVYPPYYPPELAHHASRNTPVDRSHNETFDVLMTTGLIGLVIYLVLIGSIFYHGLKWLGFVQTKLEGNLLLLLMALGSILGLFLPKGLEGTYRLSGVGLPLGILLSGVLYLILSEMIPLPKQRNPIKLKRPWLFIGLFSALVAHLIEIQFGIAVAVTRFYFWIYLAVFVLLGLGWIRKASGRGKAGYPIPQESFISRRYAKILTGSFLMATLFFTLGFEFIHNARLDENWLNIIQNSLAPSGLPGHFGLSYGVLSMFLLTWIVGSYVVITENQRGTSLAQENSGGMVDFGIYLCITLMVYFVGIILQSLNIRSATDFSVTITLYCVGMGILILLTAWSLSLDAAFQDKFCWKGALWIYPVMISISLVVIITSNISMIKADIYFKQGQLLNEHKHFNGSFQFYRQAISLAPDQDHYYAELGRTLMARTGLTTDSKGRIQLFEESFKALDRARQINPVNSDHYLLLGYLLQTWGDMEPGAEERRKKLDQSSSYYNQAAKFAPHNVQIFNLWARVFLAQGNYDDALGKLYISLSLDPKFGSTYFFLGEVYSAQAKFEEAERAYWQAIKYQSRLASAHSALGYLAFRKGDFSEAQDLILVALGIDPDQPTARSVLGLIYFRNGELQKAMEENLKVLQLLPNNLSCHKNLMLIYQKIGRMEEALFHAKRTLELSTEKERPGILKFIDQLKTAGSSNKAK